MTDGFYRQYAAFLDLTDRVPTRNVLRKQIGRAPVRQTPRVVPRLVAAAYARRPSKVSLHRPISPRNADS